MAILFTKRFDTVLKICDILIMNYSDDTARLNWLEAHGAGLNSPGGWAHVWVTGDFDRPSHYYGETYRSVIDRAMGYGPGTPATRRGKRSHEFSVGVCVSMVTPDKGARQVTSLPCRAPKFYGLRPWIIK